MIYPTLISTTCVKIRQISCIIFEIKSHFSRRNSPVFFLAQTLHTFYESSPSKCKFSDFPLLALKLTKLLMSFLQQKVSFSSKFASLFSIMREFFCTFLAETLYVIDKGSTSRCTFSDLPMLALKFAKFLKSFLELRVSFLTFYPCSTESLFISYKKFPRKQSSQVVFFNVQYIYFQDMMLASEKLI